jgi:hypothetical protein
MENSNTTIIDNLNEVCATLDKTSENNIQLGQYVSSIINSETKGPKTLTKAISELSKKANLSVRQIDRVRDNGYGIMDGPNKVLKNLKYGNSSLVESNIVSHVLASDSDIVKHTYLGIAGDSEAKVGLIIPEFSEVKNFAGIVAAFLVLACKVKVYSSTSTLVELKKITEKNVFNLCSNLIYPELSTTILAQVTADKMNELLSTEFSTQNEFLFVHTNASFQIAQRIDGTPNLKVDNYKSQGWMYLQNAKQIESIKNSLNFDE